VTLSSFLDITTVQYTAKMAVAMPKKKDTKGDEKGDPSISCMACGMDLERDHTGITCMSDHHICAKNGCALNFVKHVLGEGPSAIPVKCMDCHVDIVPNTFERNVPVESQAQYTELCVLVGGAPEPGTHWHRCPLCPNMIIMIDSEGELIYHCGHCKEATCMICSAKVEGDREMERHLMQCGAHGALRNEVIEVINTASQCVCPSCKHMGQKDDACCHMTCPACHTRWCYVCGQPRDVADGGEYEHNVDWEGNPLRCPMYLDSVSRKNAGWPADGAAAVTHFHQRKILHALRQKVEEVGVDKMTEMLELFPSTMEPFTMEDVLKAGPPRDF